MSRKKAHQTASEEAMGINPIPKKRAGRKRIAKDKRPKREKLCAGRPTVMTDETLRKLESAFRMGATDKMACLDAGIGASTLYDYCTAHPNYAEYKENLKDNLPLKALMVANKALDQSLSGTEVDKGVLQMAYKMVQRKIPGFDEKVTQDVNITDKTKASEYVAELDAIQQRISDIENGFDE